MRENNKEKKEIIKECRKVTNEWKNERKKEE